MVRKDGYSIVKIIYHALNRGRSARLSAASNWNFWTTIFICLFVTPALMFYPDFFKWVGMDFSLNHLDMGLRWVGLVVLMITFMGFTLSLHDHEYVLMGTMIHRPVELLILGVIFLMGELHWQFFVFMFMGVPLPAGVCFLLWKKQTQIETVGDYWRELAHPKKRRSKLGLWLEKLGWFILLSGLVALIQPAWLLEMVNISYSPLIAGYIRVVGWAYMILGWCYFMNARHEYDFFFDIVILQNALGLVFSVCLWLLGWFSSLIISIFVLGHLIVLLSSVICARLEMRQA